MPFSYNKDLLFYIPHCRTKSQRMLCTEPLVAIMKADITDLWQSYFMLVEVSCWFQRSLGVGTTSECYREKCCERRKIIYGAIFCNQNCFSLLCDTCPSMVSVLCHAVGGHTNTAALTSLCCNEKPNHVWIMVPTFQYLPKTREHERHKIEHRPVRP